MAASPEQKAALERSNHRLKDELKPYLQGGIWLNFISADEARQRIEDAYLPESYQRLRALKAKYDPDNRFRFSYPLI
jgi:hypothetical protein